MDAETINNLLGINDSYKAPDTLMKILLIKEQREELFRSFLEIETDLSFDWFRSYFENEHSDRKVNIIYPDGKILECQSVSECIETVKLHKSTVEKHLRDKTKTRHGIGFEYCV